MCMTGQLNKRCDAVDWLIDLSASSMCLTWTASANRLTPLNMAALPSTPNLISLLMERVAPMALEATLDAVMVDLLSSMAWGYILFRIDICENTSELDLHLLYVISSISSIHLCTILPTTLHNEHSCRKDFLRRKMMRGMSGRRGGGESHRFPKYDYCTGYVVYLHLWG